MDRSTGFGSTTGDYAPYSDSLSLRLHLSGLTLPPIVTRWVIMQKARRHMSEDMLRPLVGARFQVLLTPLAGVLFTFPSRY